MIAREAIALSPQQRPLLDERYTTRSMWDDHSPEDTWMFVSRCQGDFLASNAAHQCDQRVARRWNQWVAQRICVTADHQPDPYCKPSSETTLSGNPIYTDLFDQDYSSDLEPGGAIGDAYLELLAGEVGRRQYKKDGKCELGQ